MIATSAPHYRCYRHSGSGVVSMESGVLPRTRLLSTHEHVVLIAPRYVGICSADIRELRGERPDRHDFGHEVVGRIVESTHARFRPGMPVVLNPFRPIERETAFSELMYVAGSGAALEDALLEAPDDGREYAMVEPLACVAHAAGRAQNLRSGPVLVHGAGFFGYLLYRYLELAGVDVLLANRTLDRLSHLQERAQDLAIVRDLNRCDLRFASIFLMQTGLTRHDVAATVPLLQEGGEIILFGRVAEHDGRELSRLRRSQLRAGLTSNGTRYFLQGTLDAELDDLRTALSTIELDAFARAIASVLAPSHTFERGVAHLNRRAQSPRALDKHVVDIQSH